jgi:asparagine synthase (glutamine-hydrolysing)
LLKKAFAPELPESITRRGKQGFGIPVSAWFRGPLYDWARQVLVGEGSPLHQWFDRNTMSMLLQEHRSGHVDHGKRLYALVVLSMWAAGSNN